MTRRPATCVLVVPGIDLERQERLIMPYIAERGLRFVSLTADYGAVLALVVAELVAVVVAAVDTPSVLDLEAEVYTAGGRLEIVRRRPPRGVPERLTLQIRQAAGRGANPDMISSVLGVPIATVLEALGGALPRPAPVRSQRGRRPVGAER